MMAAPGTPALPDPDGLPNTDPQGNILGGIAKWTAYKGKHRPCDWCVLAIHQGKMNTHPRPGRLRRVGPNDTASTGPVLCHDHGGRQQLRDRDAAEVAEARRHMDRGVRR